MMIVDGETVQNMEFDVSTEWRNFKAALVQELKAAPLDEFKRAWSGKIEKTAFYGSYLLPKVAARLGYERQYELLLCDFAFVNGDGVPMVFIESENAHVTASQEIDKLCTFSSPVKVLILSCEWADGEREKWLPVWTKRIAARHKSCDLNAVYMIVIGEWGRGQPDDGMLRYYIESVDPSGNRFDREELPLCQSQF